MTRDDRDLALWLRHVRSGNWLSVGVLLMLAGHLVLQPAGPNRPALWSLIAAGAAFTVLGLFFPWRRLLRHRVREYYLLGWSLLIVAFTLATVVVDGGAESSIQLLLVLPIVFAGMAYRPMFVVVVATAVLAGRGAVGMITDTFDGDQALLRSGVLITIAVMSGLIAHAHREQSRRLTEAAELLQELAHRDPLTGCLNRRAFERRLEEIARSDRPVGLLLFDIDRFKDVNDTEGHLAGDAMLVRVADELRANARTGDAVARLGGDEFAILLPDTDAVATDGAAARFREALQRHDLLAGVTVSVGYTHSDAAGHDREHLIGLADRELYAAKEQRGLHDEFSGPAPSATTSV